MTFRRATALTTILALLASFAIALAALPLAAEAEPTIEALEASTLTYGTDEGEEPTEEREDDERDDDERDEDSAGSGHALCHVASDAHALGDRWTQTRHARRTRESLGAERAAHTRSIERPPHA